MKKKIITIILCIEALTISLTGCQSATKSFGGTTTLNLDPGLKLEEITWKDDNLWYMTRPMRADEVAETHTFNQSRDFGPEGEVIVIEHNKEE